MLCFYVYLLNFLFAYTNGAMKNLFKIVNNSHLATRAKPYFGTFLMVWLSTSTGIIVILLSSYAIKFMLSWQLCNLGFAFGIIIIDTHVGYNYNADPKTQFDGANIPLCLVSSFSLDFNVVIETPKCQTV